MMCDDSSGFCESEFITSLLISFFICFHAHVFDIAKNLKDLLSSGVYRNQP